MFARLTFLARMLYWPLKPLVQCKIVAAPPSQSALGADKPLFYITKVSSASDLATLIVTIFQNGGTLSNNRRKRYADRVQAHVLDAVESAVARAMRGDPLDDAEQG